VLVSLALGTGMDRAGLAELFEAPPQG
jgi:hypothetical protein